MKILKGKTVNMDCDFWYDLTDGGYIKPEELIADKEEVKRVIEAIHLVKEFEESLLEEYPLDEEDD